MEILLMYAWLKIDDLRLALGALAIFFAFAVIVQYIYRADGNAKYVPKKIKTLLVTSTASLMLDLQFLAPLKPAYSLQLTTA